MNLIPNETSSGWGGQTTASTSNRQWSVDSNDQWLINGNLNQTNQNSNRNSLNNNNQTSNISSSNSQLNLTHSLSNSTQNINSINQSNSINDLDSQMTNNWSQLTQIAADCQQAQATGSIANNNSTSSSSNNQLDSPTNANQSSTLATNQQTDSQNDLLINKTGIKDEILYSLDWGSTPIDQTTPWDCPSNHQSPPKEINSINGVIDNSWRYSMATIGTEIWESNIRKKSISLNTDQTAVDLQQQKNNLNSNWNSPTNQIAPNSLVNHLGGTWGEDDHMNSNKMLWNQGANPMNNNGNSNPSINNNWLENEKSNGWMNGNEDKMNTWNSNSVKDYGGWSEQDPNSIVNDNLNDDGTALWNSNKRQNGGTNPRWKDNDLLLKQNKPNNNLTNQCANGGFNAQNNNFSTSPAGVLRLPNSANSIQSVNKVQTLPQASAVNWNDQKNQLNSNNLNGTAQLNNMFWSNDSNNAQLNSNWGNKINNVNQDDWNNKLKKEMILGSQQFKLLIEKGFRKDSIEAALRNSNMNIKDAIEELRADALKENSNDLDKRKNSGFNNHTSSLPPNSSINRNTSQQQFNHQLSQQQLQPNQIFRNNNNKAQYTANPMLQNNKNLGSLVQQIQLAVQSGHLNAQILHQPLSVGSIQLIHQLLQQIKSLQTLQLQASNINKNMGGPNSQSDLNVQITMIKQRISTLQNQIKVQQSVFMNSQQQPNQQSVSNADLNNGLSINPSVAATNNLTSDFKNLISPDSNLINDFRDLQMNNNQSRLSTWKNSASFENNNNNQIQGGFSRAPGSLNNNANNNWSTANAGFNNGNEETWNNNLNETAVATVSNGLKDVLNLQSQTSFINDSVPEFEPGKPWKGTQIKSSDDDPHLTPGSVNRSIISLNNFQNNWPSKNNNTSNLHPSTTNTWSYHNNSNNNNNTAISSNASTNWNGGSFSNEGQVENLWQQNQNSNKSKAGPPPGLSSNKSKLSYWDDKPKNISSTLMIKNLTPQIDESTLKTLCMQHGPLQNFQVLNNGLAIVKYKSKEEAIKAQSTLNNCLLSNTKIFVDILPEEESETQNYLSGQTQQLSNGVFLNGHSMMSNNQQTNANPWRNTQVTSESQWSFGNSLWNNSLDANSTMQNLLPGDLLNGESA